MGRTESHIQILPFDPHHAPLLGESSVLLNPVISIQATNPIVFDDVCSPAGSTGNLLQYPDPSTWYQIRCRFYRRLTNDPRCARRPPSRGTQQRGYFPLVSVPSSPPTRQQPTSSLQSERQVGARSSRSRIYGTSCEDPPWTAHRR